MDAVEQMYRQISTPSPPETTKPAPVSAEPKGIELIRADVNSLSSERERPLSNTDQQRLSSFSIINLDSPRASIGRDYVRLWFGRNNCCSFADCFYRALYMNPRLWARATKCASRC